MAESYDIVESADDSAPEDDEAAKAKKSDDAILDEARKRYKLCCDGMSDEDRIAAIDDLNFLKGGVNQWDSRAVASRTADGRPIITVNTLPTYLHQVTNDQRMNTPSIKIHPVGDRADVETAKVRQGMIRHIEYDSNADVAYDTAVNSAAAIGFGYFYLETDFESPSSFDQKLIIRRVRNAFSVRIDPLSTEADGSDQQYSFIECPYSRPEFKRKWPKATACDVSLYGDSGTQYTGWLSDQTVLVCDYYCIEYTEATAILLSNGENGFREDLLALPPGVTIVKERKSQKPKVMLYKITAVDVLERTEIKCKWIPVFPVYGDEIDVQGKVYRAGIIRNAKGPCQSYNVMMSGATEEIALRSKAPFIGAEGQFEGHEDDWAQANNRAFPYLEYKPTTVDGKLAPPPQRQPMADIPTGYLALAMHARDNVKATTGLFDSSLGAKGTATSGIQEREQQRQGDMANFHYQDGLIRTIRHLGRCIDCMIPSYYDTERVVAIMREDETLDFAKINEPTVQQQQGPSGEMMAIQAVLNDMTCGEYAVTVSAGPSYSTMREESQEFFTNAMQAAKDPATAGVLTWAAMKSSDAPGAELATKMLGKLLPPPAQQVIDEENGDKEPQPMVDTPQGPVPLGQASAMIAQLMQTIAQAEEQLKQADAAKSQAEAMKQQQLMKEQELEPARQAVEMKKLEADLAKSEATQATAAASLAQAQADMVRAQSEAAIAPHKGEAEVYTAMAHAMKAENELRQPVAAPKDPGQEAAEKEQKEAKSMENIAGLIAKSRPKGADLTIKAPSGMTYDVAATLR